MNYETVVGYLLARIPRLQTGWETKLDRLKDEPRLPYIVFGSVLIPALEEALATANLGRILPITAFLEDAAEAARNDVRLEELLRDEIGEWLKGAANEAYLDPWLGSETKRICGYVPGLAMRQRAAPEKRKARSWLATLLDRFRAK